MCRDCDILQAVCWVFKPICQTFEFPRDLREGIGLVIALAVGRCQDVEVEGSKIGTAVDDVFSEMGYLVIRASEVVIKFVKYALG